MSCKEYKQSQRYHCVFSWLRGGVPLVYVGEPLVFITLCCIQPAVPCTPVCPGRECWSWSPTEQTSLLQCWCAREGICIHRTPHRSRPYIVAAVPMLLWFCTYWGRKQTVCLLFILTLFVFFPAHADVVASVCTSIQLKNKKPVLLSSVH